MKSARQIAESLVERYLRPDSVASVGGITATLNNWRDSWQQPEKINWPNLDQIEDAAMQYDDSNAFEQGALWVKAFVKMKVRERS